MQPTGLARFRTQMKAAAIVGLSIAVPEGLSPGAVSAQGFQVRDSAGTRIILNSTLNVPAWGIGAEPELQIGTLAGGPEEFFEITAVAIDSAGRILVLDGGNASIRIFDSRGDYVTTIGRKGSGPGEFERPVGMWVSGRSIHVWDPRLMRLTVFTTDGELERTVDVRDVPGTVVVSVFSDGRFILRKDRTGRPAGRQLESFYSHFFLAGDEGDLIRELPTLLFARWGLTGDSPRPYQLLFTHFLQTAGAATGYWAGTTEREEIRRFTPALRDRNCAEVPRKERK